MGHDHGPETEADHCHMSAKYTEYIKTHLDLLKQKCKQFMACINNLLEDANVLLVLKGENISLNKTCGLVYQRGGAYMTSSIKCSNADREDIRKDLEDDLELQLRNTGDWKSIRKCLGNSYGDKERSTYVNEICGLAYKDKELCRNFNIHRTVETFFNQQIQQLKCTCKSLEEDAASHSHVSLPVIIGAGAGGFLLLALLLVFCIVCYRRRKSRKRKKRSPNVIYLPAPNGDNHPIYQEVYDPHPYLQGPSSNPPTLPMRYTPHPTAGSGQSEEPAYLEPVEMSAKYRPKMPLPVNSTSNPGYEAPPKYSEFASDDKEPNPEDKDNGYFQPIPSPKQEEDGGYDTLGRNKSGPSSPPDGYESVEVLRSSAPLEAAPAVPSDVPLGPVPAKRTKKGDRETESHYFVLERESAVDTDTGTGTGTGTAV